jgi:hypothetical protein
MRIAYRPPVREKEQGGYFGFEGDGLYYIEVRGGGDC